MDGHKTVWENNGLGKGGGDNIELLSTYGFKQKYKKYKKYNNYKNDKVQKVQKVQTAQKQDGVKYTQKVRKCNGDV